MSKQSERRITLVHDRFQACCDVCGVVSTHLTQADAIRAATRHTCPESMVWDAMHRRGDSDGVVWRKTDDEALRRLDEKLAAKIKAFTDSVRLSGEDLAIRINPRDGA